MSDKSKRECRDLYNRLRTQALQPGESLCITWHEYHADKKRLATYQEKMQRWLAK